MMALLLTWLCWPWLAWRARAARATPVRRILLIQTAKIGDMLCATPVIAALRAAYPHAELTVLHDPITSRIIAQQPGLRRLAQPARAFRGLAGRRALLRLLRDGQYDTVLTLSPNLSFWLAPFWAGAARRWSIVPTWPGRTLAAARACLSDGEAHQPGELVLDTLARLLARHGVTLGRDKQIHLADSAAAALAALHQPAGRAIGLGVSAANKLKELGVPKLVEVCQRLLAASDAHLVLIGSGGDSPLAQAIASQVNSPRLIDATGRFQLDELPALLQRLDAYVGVDSGITYLADTVHTPIVTVVGPTDPREQRALGQRVIRIAPVDLPCYPCAFVFATPSRCHTGTRACIESISAQQIADAALSLLDADADRKAPV